MRTLPSVVRGTPWPMRNISTYDHVPGVTIDRQCGSSQQAVHFAAQGVMSGTQDLVVAGGLQNMSAIPISAAMLVADQSGFTTPFEVHWGGPGYVPVPGDYDGDRKTDPAIYQPSTGWWFILKSKSNSNYVDSTAINWGDALKDERPPGGARTSLPFTAGGRFRSAFRRS